MRRGAALVMKAALFEIFGNIRDGFEVAGVPQSQIKSISEAATLERGRFSHRPRNDPRFFGGRVPWVQIQNLPGGYRKYITEHMNTLNDQGVAISKIFPRGTLILSIAATIGAVGILTFDSCFPDSLVGIKPENSIIDSDFLYWQLVFIRDYLEEIAPSAAQKNINLQILSSINLWVPSLKKQKAINTYLDSFESSEGEMQQLLDQDEKLLDQLEQSILERAFRGEL
jgi:type I restriction enzyme S subunit